MEDTGHTIFGEKLEESMEIVEKQNLIFSAKYYTKVAKIYSVNSLKSMSLYRIMTNKENNMPFVEIKVFEDELTSEQSKALIQKVTDAVTEVTSEKLRGVTWVVINEVKSGNWGVGGNALGLDDVKKIISSG